GEVQTKSFMGIHTGIKPTTPEDRKLALTKRNTAIDMFEQFRVSFLHRSDVAQCLLRQERVFRIVDLPHHCMRRRVDDKILPDVICDELRVEQEYCEAVLLTDRRADDSSLILAQLFRFFHPMDIDIGRALDVLKIALNAVEYELRPRRLVDNRRLLNVER